MNKNKPQSGNVYLIIIVSLAVILLGSLGFIFYQNFMQTKTTNNTNDISTIDRQKNDALATVKKVYGTTTNSNTTSILQENLTPSFYEQTQKPSSYDIVFCSQNAYESASYGEPIITSETIGDNSTDVIKVSVSEFFGDKGDYKLMNFVDVFVDITTNKIKSVSCPESSSLVK